jgi:hypothetical protein
MKIVKVSLSLVWFHLLASSALGYFGLNVAKNTPLTERFYYGNIGMGLIEGIAIVILAAIVATVLSCKTIWKAARA